MDTHAAPDAASARTQVEPTRGRLLRLGVKIETVLFVLTVLSTAALVPFTLEHMPDFRGVDPANPLETLPLLAPMLLGHTAIFMAKLLVFGVLACKWVLGRRMGDCVPLLVYAERDEPVPVTPDTLVPLTWNNTTWFFLHALLRRVLVSMVCSSGASVPLLALTGLVVYTEGSMASLAVTLSVLTIYLLVVLTVSLYVPFSWMSKRAFRGMRLVLVTP